MARYTNQDLHDQIHDIGKMVKSMMPKVDSLWTWKNQLDGIEKYKLSQAQSVPKSPKDYLWQALAILGAAMGIISLLVKYVVEGGH